MPVIPPLNLNIGTSKPAALKIGLIHILYGEDRNNVNVTCLNWAFQKLEIKKTSPFRQVKNYGVPPKII